MLNESMRDEAESAALRSNELVEAIKPLLADQGPAVQGTVLGELVALWLARHHPMIRDDVLAEWIEFMRELVPVSELAIFGADGFPQHGDH